MSKQDRNKWSYDVRNRNMSHHEAGHAVAYTIMGRKHVTQAVFRVGGCIIGGTAYNPFELLFKQNVHNENETIFCVLAGFCAQALLEKHWQEKYHEYEINQFGDSHIKSCDLIILLNYIRDKLSQKFGKKPTKQEEQEFVRSCIKKITDILAAHPKFLAYINKLAEIQEKKTFVGPNTIKNIGEQADIGKDDEKDLRSAINTIDFFDFKK